MLIAVNMEAGYWPLSNISLAYIPRRTHVHVGAYTLPQDCDFIYKQRHPHPSEANVPWEWLAWGAEGWFSFLEQHRELLVIPAWQLLLSYIVAVSPPLNQWCDCDCYWPRRCCKCNRPNRPILFTARRYVSAGTSYGYVSVCVRHKSVCFM